MDQKNEAMGTAATGATLAGEAGTTQPVRRRPVVYLNDIRQRAFERWQAAGSPRGDNCRFWLEAEDELLHGR
jgi:Protein of unknown function (DUF2934)